MASNQFIIYVSHKDTPYHLQNPAPCSSLQEASEIIGYEFDLHENSNNISEFTFKVKSVETGVMYTYNPKNKTLEH